MKCFYMTAHSTEMNKHVYPGITKIWQEQWLAMQTYYLNIIDRQQSEQENNAVIHHASSEKLSIIILPLH
jgi:hypothetical protein